MGGLKSVVTICAWILFVFGCVMLINTVVQSCCYELSAKLTMAGGAIAMLSFFLTAVTVKIRHKID